MIPKHSFFCLILLIIGLLTRIAQSTEYIKNSEFLTTPQGKASAKPEDNFVVDNWYGVFPRGSSQKSFIKVITASNINPSSPQVNAIVLMNSNITQGSDNNVCIYQEIGTVNAGQYTFSFVSIISQTNPNPQNEKLQVQISGERQTQSGSMEYAMLLNKNVQFDKVGEVRYEDLLVVKDELKSVYLLICNTPLVVYGAKKTTIAEIAIRNVHLVSGKVAKNDDSSMAITAAKAQDSRVSTVRQSTTVTPPLDEQEVFVEPKQPTIQELEANLVRPPPESEESFVDGDFHEKVAKEMGFIPLVLPIVVEPVPKPVVQPQVPKQVVKPTVIEPTNTQSVVVPPIPIVDTSKNTIQERPVAINVQKPSAQSTDKARQTIKVQTQVPTKQDAITIQDTKAVIIVDSKPTLPQINTDIKPIVIVDESKNSIAQNTSTPKETQTQTKPTIKDISIPSQAQSAQPSSHIQSKTPSSLSPPSFNNNPQTSSVTIKDLINYYLTGSAQIVKTDDKSFIFYKSGDRTFALFVDQTYSDGLVFINSQGQRLFLNHTKGSKPQSVLVDVNGNFYVDVGDGKVEQLVDSVNKAKRRSFLVDGNRNLYVRNNDGSLTYFSGPNAGTTIYSDAQGTYLLNYDGSRHYITQTKTKQTPSTPSGSQQKPNIQEKPQQKHSSQIPASPTNTPTSPPTSIDQSTDITQQIASPSLQQIINRFISGKAKIVKTDDKSYIYYKDANGRHFAVFIEQTYQDGIAYTDSQGNKYFLGNQKGSQPLPITKDDKGNLIVKLNNGELKTLVTPKVQQVRKAEQQSTSISPANISSSKPPIATDPKPLPITYTDTFGNRYTLQANNARLYSTGPFKGKQLFVDENNDLFTVNRDNTRTYFTGDNFGKVIAVDANGNPYAWNSDGTAVYITGEFKGVKIQKDGDGNLYRLAKDGRRTYVNGNLAGKVTSIDSKGDFYFLNEDSSRKYVSGQFSGNTLFADLRGQLYLKVSDTQRHYMTGQSAGKILTVDHYGDLYTETQDGGRLYLTGEFKGKHVFSDMMNYIYAKNKDGSREYLSGEMKGKVVWVDEVTKDLYVLNAEGKKVYLTGPLMVKNGESSSSVNTQPTVPKTSVGQGMIVIHEQIAKAQKKQDINRDVVGQKQLTNGQQETKSTITVGQTKMSKELQPKTMSQQTSSTQRTVTPKHPQTIVVTPLMTVPQPNKSQIQTATVSTTTSTAKDIQISPTVPPIKPLSTFHQSTPAFQVVTIKNIAAQPQIKPLNIQKTIDKPLIEPQTAAKLISPSIQPLEPIFTPREPILPSTPIISPSSQTVISEKTTTIPQAKPTSQLTTTGIITTIPPTSQSITKNIPTPTQSSTPILVPNQKPATQSTQSIQPVPSYQPSITPQFVNPFPGSFVNPFLNQPSAYQTTTSPLPTFKDDFVKPPTIATPLHPYIFIDPSSKTKFILSKDGKRNNLSIVPGSSVTANPAVYHYEQGGMYFVYVDEISGNRYVKSKEGGKVFLTGFDSSAVKGQEIKDQQGGVYAVYVDREKNEYVTYNENGKWFYYDNKQGKVQLSTQSATTLSSTPQNTQSSPPTKTSSSSQLIYLTSTNQQYTLTPSGIRTYLHLISSDSKSFIVQDPNNTPYTIFIDDQNNLYTNNGALKNYLTGHPFEPIGQKIIGKDTQGITYSTVSDSYGNTYVVYADINGMYFYDSNRNQVYIRNSGNLRAMN